MPQPPDMGREPEPLPRRPGAAPGEPDVPGVEPLARSKRGRWIVAIIVVLLLIGIAVALAVAADDDGDERTAAVPALVARDEPHDRYGGAQRGGAWPGPASGPGGGDRPGSGHLAPDMHAPG
ncbi:MAG: hypothetical protein ACLFXM_04885 [Acidimicrobiia bacterium]